MGHPPWIDDQFMGNCELVLDDGPQFRESKFGKAYEHNSEIRNHVELRLNVHDAVVSYSGGKLIPFTILNCFNCVFRTQVTQRPPPEGQKVISQLLTADLKVIKFTGEGN
jgi:hypothetical protein